MDQSEKYHLSLAGEYYVAAELQRRNLQASVTYGNAKQTDVVIFCPSSHRAVVIEVKTTTKDGWIVGNVVPQPSDKPWVLVHVSREPSGAPQYHVLTQRELHDLLAPGDTRYRDNYRAKHGREFEGTGVVTLSLKDAEPHAGKWEKIVALVRDS